MSESENEPVDQANVCELCGFPLDSRIHKEGRGDIHIVKPKPGRKSEK